MKALIGAIFGGAAGWVVGYFVVIVRFEQARAGFEEAAAMFEGIPEYIEYIRRTMPSTYDVYAMAPTAPHTIIVAVAGAALGTLIGLLAMRKPQLKGSTMTAIAIAGSLALLAAVILLSG